MLLGVVLVEQVRLAAVAGRGWVAGVKGKLAILTSPFVLVSLEGFSAVRADT